MIADRRTRTELPPAETWVVMALRAISLTAAAAAILLELALPAGTVAAVLGTLGASIVGSLLARSRLRLPVVWFASALCAASALLLGVLIVDESAAAQLLGPHGAMEAADVVRFGLLAVAVAMAVRTTSARVPWFAIVELGLVVMALSGVVAAHRDGAINHPRLLSDWAWTHGIDPAEILLYFGMATLVALLLATIHERKGRGPRVAIHLLLLGALAAASLLLVRTTGLPRPPRGEGDKKEDKNRGKGKDGKGDKGSEAGGKGGNAQQSQDPLPFRNENQSQSTSPVAVVLLHDDYSPPLGYYYFRQSALSQWNGTRLVASTRDDVDRDIMDGFPSEKKAVQDAPKAGPERSTIRTTVAMLADHARPFGLESPTDFTPRESPDPARFTRAYDVTSAALSTRYEDLLGHKPGVKTWTDEQRAAYTQLPDDPRYKKLADDIINESLRPEFRNDPFAEAIAISGWLGKNSIYSLKSQHADEHDPTGSFLFGDRIGYCVHFAHSAAYLLRARGLPTRIAEGYVADEARRGNGSSILIRQKDAHAWAELYLDGFGWIIVDVAPQRVLDPPDSPPDPDLQRMLGELARGDKTAGRNPDAQPRIIDWRGMARDGLYAMLAVLVALHSIRAWRRIAPWLAGPRSIHRVTYRAALDGLCEAGFVREIGETRERFAARVGAHSPSLAPLTDAHLARAWGSRTLLPLGEMRRRYALTAADTRRRTPWWRLVIANLLPVFWLQSR